MKIGDLVKRNLNCAAWQDAREQYHRLGHGLVLSKHIAGSPPHRCVAVYYPKTGQIFDIAESLMVVISESR